MQTVVLGDVHGNLDSLKRTLTRLGVTDTLNKRRPGFRVIQVGDLLNMSPAGVPFRGFLSKDKETLEFVLESRVIDEVLVGNHEVFYTHGLEAGRWHGMALHRAEFEDGMIGLIIDAVDNGLFTAATEAHGSLITHAGIGDWQEWMGDDPEQIADALNEALIQVAIRDSDSNGFSSIVGAGSNPNASIFWNRPWDFKRKAPFSQIVGHTPHPSHPRFFHELGLWVVDNGAYMDHGLIPSLSWDGEGWEAL